MPEIGWRFWRVSPYSHRLYSPEARCPYPDAAESQGGGSHVLPPNGIYVSHCHVVPGHWPPVNGCVCGIYYWDTQARAQRGLGAAGVWRQGRHPTAAVTIGVLGGDTKPSPSVGWTIHGLPILAAERRCTAYQVRAILHPTIAAFPYDVPAVQGTSLELLAPFVSAAQRDDGQ